LFVCVQVGEINSPDVHGFDLMVFRRGFLRMVVIMVKNGVDIMWIYPLIN